MNMNNEIFDQIAENYREIHEESLNGVGADSAYFSEYKIKELTKWFSRQTPIKILDMGCGDGLSSIFFQKYFPNSNYTGIDISQESIKTANKSNNNFASFCLFNGKDIPFEDNIFDLVFISCVLHHIEPSEHVALFKEINRVLTPQGKLVIFEHNPFNPITQRIVNNCIFDEDAILVRPFRLKSQLTKLNFSKISLNFTLFFPRHKIFKPLLFLENIFRKIPLGGQYYIICSKK